MTNKKEVMRFKTVCIWGVRVRAHATACLRGSEDKPQNQFSLHHMGFEGQTHQA